MDGAIALELPDADVRLVRGWLPRAQADALFAALRADVPWQVHRIRLFGREVDSPRLSCWIGDPGAVYVYSGMRHAPEPWPPALRAVRARLTRTLAHPFNSVLANLYRDGRDAMGWHSDDEPELGPEPLIASLSLGATRRFSLKRRAGPAAKCTVELEHGSMLLMAAATQRHYRHALPRTGRPVGERINLTFRRILA
ncbi:alpha-ketoglutarate-dependent dioxygenase AlkB family protein [Luteimonas aquatica]|uniref:alpha-ketoglutarate-dependent dioxygenase AlkB family protein n=1 Tax=Luteimonas aquatica TaxID=450364 RepID=UPI001F5A5ED0|nr:alpha-ketoglutarate-dependent dioxygenase AlkB [Luteimonas aquatica]